MRFPDNFYEYLESHTLIEIKGGKDRETFLEIWMVTVGSRVFARSWNKSKKSWFIEFIDTGIGQIKYGNMVMDVRGKKVKSADPLNNFINGAYLEKYTQKENQKYVTGITAPEYADFTMEFLYVKNA